MGGRGDDDGDAVVRVRPHWIHFSGAAGFAAFVALVGMLLVRHNDLPRSTDLRIVAWCVGIAALGFVGPLLRWRRTWLEVRAGVVRCTLGLLRARAVSVETAGARHVDVEQSVLGRLLGYGRIHVVDANGVEHVFPPVEASSRLTRALSPSSSRGPSRTG